jgi:antitoxin YefM
LLIIDFAYSKAYAGIFAEAFDMTSCNATEARANLYSLIDETAATHEPILITGKRGNAILIAENDWRSINETLYLLSVPNMRESIREGVAQGLDDCSKELDW